MFFSVYTLGCKLNQLETEAISDSFRREGFTFLEWEQVSAEQDDTEASIRIINTCTVTSMAEQKARRVIRKTLREHPQSCLIVTGCYAQMESSALASLGETGAGRLFVVPGDKKDRLLELPRFLAGPGNALSPESLPGLVSSFLAAESSRDTAGGAFQFVPEKFTSHSRGFLKIQDGCDSRCAYCRVSLARGKSQSLSAKEALKTLLSLEERGFTEAVLIGVNISQYHDGETDLFGLLDFLLKGTKTIRLRLSSIEPEQFAAWKGKSGFVGVLSNQRLRPHFHLSLQSASDRILSEMGRSYTAEDVEGMVSLLRSVRDDPFLACDIIAGFPGETEGEFEKTYAFCKKTGFAWIHAFPFSPRPGTAAVNFPGRVCERDAVRRVELLTGLARNGRRDYIRRWEGRELEAVVVKNGAPEGFITALSENYLKLLVSSGGNPVPAPGVLVSCRLCGNNPDDTFDARAEIVPCGS